MSLCLSTPLNRGDDTKGITIEMPDGRRIHIYAQPRNCGNVRLIFDAPRDVQIVRDNAVNREPPVNQEAPA